MQNLQTKNKIVRVFAAVACSLMLISAAAPALADFNPNQIISDGSFTDTQTFGGANGIQQFLANKGSVLANTSPNFLLMLKEPQDSAIKQGLNDPEPNLPQLRSAAQLIWDASQMTGINPQVILVTLQKEQSLITGTFNDQTALQTALNHALGFNCTDSAGCSQTFNGFYFQLFGNFDAAGDRYIGAPASLMRSFNTAGGRGPGVDINNDTFGSPIVRTSKVGDIITLDNTQGPPNNAAPTQTVTLGDLATAALYRYTPHVYNGNYNFWKFFSTWFKYANGTLLQIAGQPTIYIVNNGALQQMPAFVMESHGLNPQTVTTTQISQNEFSSYTTSSAYPPQDNTIVSVSGDTTHPYYVFEQGIAHPVSQFVLKQRGLDPNNQFNISASDFALYQTGSLLAPKDGTLIKGNQSPTVYVAQNGRLMYLSAFTFKQYGYSPKNIVVLPQSEVDQYAVGGFLLPQNGTLLTIGKGTQGYLLKDQILEPISYTVFKLLGYKFSSFVNLSAGEVANASIGSFAAPPEGTYFITDQANNYYLYKNGTAHPISSFVAGQLGIAKKAVTLSLAEGLSYPEGSPVPPKDGTLIKGDQSTGIFAIANGQKVLLDYNTWVKTYKKRTPVTLPQVEVDSYQTAGDQNLQQ